MHVARLAVVLVVGVGALAAPGSASGWHYKFLDFFDFAPPNASGTSVIKAKKCHGGKLGTYKYRSRTEAQGGETELAIEVRAKLPVTEKFKPIKDVEVIVEASDNIDPVIPVEISEKLADFFSGTEARWKPNKHKLIFDHPALSFSFGFFEQHVLPAERVAVKFKPKPGC
jgi:hypothetical protein